MIFGRLIEAPRCALYKPRQDEHVLCLLSWVMLDPPRAEKKAAVVVLSWLICSMGDKLSFKTDVR